MSGVSSTPSSRKTSRRTSPVEDASATIRLIWPNRVLSWWWSTLMESGTRPSTSGSAIRLSFAQSTARRTRSATSSGQRRWSSPSGMNPYSAGSGASPCSTITVSLPSCSSARFAASSEPRASPSGFSCVVRTNRSCSRIASATAVRSLAVVWGELIDQLCHADPTFDRRIVLERKLGSPFHAQLARQLGLQQRMGGLDTVDRLRPLSFGAEDGHVDPCVPEVGRGFDSRNRDEADAGVLQLPDRFGQDLANGLVDAAHPISHAGYSSACTLSSSSQWASGASSPRWRAALWASCWGTSASPCSSSLPRARWQARARTS